MVSVASTIAMTADLLGILGQHCSSPVRLQTFQPSCVTDRVEITSAFLAYVQHHEILPDIAGLDDAVALAVEAPARLQDAKALEDVLCSPLSWNRSAWTMWGGIYGGPERGGLEKEEAAVRENEAADVDDGGWSVEPGT